MSINDRKIIENLYQNREGLRVQTLIKLTNFKQSLVYKRLNILKKRNLIENRYPIWKIIDGQVENCVTLIKSSNLFELHNLSYVLKLIKVPEWWSQRKNRLIRLKGWQFSHIPFGNGSTNPYQQLINDNFVIQTYPESIIIIARKRYYSNQPYEVIIQAINEVLDLISWFEERMRFKFFPDGIPCLELRNNDYNRINDILANQCKKDGKRILIEIDKNRKVWVDYSEPFGKEANYPEAQEKLERVTKDILLKPSLLPSEITQMVGQVTQNQLMFNHNFETHVLAVHSLSNQVERLGKEIIKLNSIINSLKKK